jgi:hypothetical protein
MENGEDESELKQRRAQDLIETIAPPRARRSTRRTDLPGPADLPEIDWGLDASEADVLDAEGPGSPDEIPTERPPWSDPAESRERPIPGVPMLPVKKNA